MRELRFEDYADAFAITEDILRKQDSGVAARLYCLVAEESGLRLGCLFITSSPSLSRKTKHW